MVFRSFTAALMLLALGSIATAQVTRENGTFALTVGQAPWSILFPVGDLSVQETKFGPDGLMGYLFLTGEKSHLNISFYIEPAVESKDPAVLRDMAWEREKSHFGTPTDVVKRQTPEYAVIEYTFPELQGMAVNQKNVRMHMVRDGYWIDLHISKVLYEDGDKAAFDAFLKSISFTPRTPEAKDGKPVVAEGSSLDFWLKGSAAYEQQDLEQARGWYEKALDLEKTKRSLSDVYWKVLIDNLGMSQAIGGDLEAARKTFNYGLSQDSTYPMFYYELACTYAEMGKLDESMAELKLAFKYRKNTIEGESMPDPADDPSFKKYLNDEKFRRTMQEIQKD